MLRPLPSLALPRSPTSLWTWLRREVRPHTPAVHAVSEESLLVSRWNVAALIGQFKCSLDFSPRGYGRDSSISF